LRVRIDYFGAKRQLLGAFHIAQRLQPRSTAVLLCNPFGEEASRSHRTFRVLATQLERAGFSVLRFDYSGTGDSLGSGDDATVDAWIADIGIAAEALQQASGVKKVALVGLRLGATLAMLASARGGLRPRQLVMWDPIVDGAAYLRELVAQHREYMRAELGPSWRDDTRMRSDGTPIEAFGAPVSEALAHGLQRIDLTTVKSTAEQIAVVATKPNDSLRSALPAARWIELGESAAWNSDDALNAMIVPMDAVQAIVAQLEKGP
jgi:pimeloyl-ACP methyl ester carboxylesterase